MIFQDINSKYYFQIKPTLEARLLNIFFFVFFLAFSNYNLPLSTSHLGEKINDVVYEVMITSTMSLSTPANNVEDGPQFVGFYVI